MKTQLEAFKYQMECDRSYISKGDLVVMDIGQQHLLDQFEELLKGTEKLNQKLRWIVEHGELSHKSNLIGVAKEGLNK